MSESTPRHLFSGSDDAILLNPKPFEITTQSHSQRTIIENSMRIMIFEFNMSPIKSQKKMWKLMGYAEPILPEETQKMSTHSETYPSPSENIPYRTVEEYCKTQIEYEMQKPLPNNILIEFLKKLEKSEISKSPTGKIEHYLEKETDYALQLSVLTKADEDTKRLEQERLEMMEFIRQKEEERRLKEMSTVKLEDDVNEDDYELEECSEIEEGLDAGKCLDAESEVEYADDIKEEIE
jgi:hypothetical protein